MKAGSLKNILQEGGMNTELSVVGNSQNEDFLERKSHQDNFKFFSSHWKKIVQSLLFPTRYYYWQLHHKLKLADSSQKFHFLGATWTISGRSKKQ